MSENVPELPPSPVLSSRRNARKWKNRNSKISRHRKLESTCSAMDFKENKSFPNDLVLKKNQYNTIEDENSSNQTEEVETKFSGENCTTVTPTNSTKNTSNMIIEDKHYFSHPSRSSVAKFEGFKSNDISRYCKLLKVYQNVTLKSFANQHSDTEQGFSNYEVSECTQLLNDYYELYQKLKKSRKRKLNPEENDNCKKSAPFSQESTETSSNDEFNENQLANNLNTTVENLENPIGTGSLCLNLNKEHSNASNAINQSEDCLQEAKKLCMEVEEVQVTDNKKNCQTVEFRGFASASGKEIITSEQSLNAAKKLWNDELMNTNCDDMAGFMNASGKKIKTSKESLETAKKLWSSEIGTFATSSMKIETDRENMPLSLNKGFSSASGRIIQTSHKSLQNAKRLFSELKEEPQESDVESPEIVKFGGFASASGKAIVTSKQAQDTAKKLLNDDRSGETEQMEGSASASFQEKLENNLNELKKELNCEKFNLFSKNIVPELEKCQVSDKENSENVQFGGFASASGKKIQTSKESLEAARKLWMDDSLNTTLQSPCNEGFARASGKKISVSDNALKNANRLLEDEHPQNLSIKLNLSNRVKIEQNIDASFNTPIRASTRNASKRRLGISSCKPIQVSNVQLEKAKLAFSELTASNSHVKQNLPFTSTPHKDQCETVSVPKNNFFKDSDVNITPIKLIPCEPFLEEQIVHNQSSITFRDTQDDGFSALERRIKVLTDRANIIRMQENRLHKTQQGRQAGVLFKRKSQNQKMSLSTFVGNTRPGQYFNAHFACVTPENADKLHFTVDENLSFVQTSDGAQVVPNVDNQIGLIEFTRAFKSINGIDVNLIPNNWIKNHYKWIVWKLASYERMFPKHFSNCLNVDNVMQQLKYRYDREIDQVKRPTLRKIYEKDQPPQLRMCLCVSHIFQIKCNQFELELTDGWYSIRCLIDDLLSEQVRKKRIQVGTKLITCNAELLNCDGCHPLDASDVVRLKINFNSTRRACWYAKLGIQRFAANMVLNIASCRPCGGVISAVRVYIARVYPLRYYDRTGDMRVWRNSKAEQYDSQIWELDNNKNVDEIRENVCKELEDRDKCSRKMSTNCDRISEIRCSKTLYEMLENSNDPEYFGGQLSLSQREAVCNYKMMVVEAKQREVEGIIRERILKRNKCQRNVSAVLAATIFDCNDSSLRKYSFNIWEPSDEQLECLTEGIVVTMYNLISKYKGTISCTRKTYFRQERAENMSRFSQFQRTYCPIASLNCSNFREDFKEFDTVGVLIQYKVMESFQEIWLADLEGKLLVITVPMGPKTCLLLDHLKREQIVSVSNLIFVKQRANWIEANASYDTIFSAYPQHKHLQNGIKLFSNNMPNSLSDFVRQCEDRISHLVSLSKTNEINSMSMNVSNDIESDETTLVYDRVTSSDIAMSLINIDEFL